MVMSDLSFEFLRPATYSPVVASLDLDGTKEKPTTLLDPRERQTMARNKLALIMVNNKIYSEVQVESVDSDLF